MSENQRINKVRLSLGLTMEEFGKRIGITRSTVSRLEGGGIAITEKVRLAICREYKVMEEWLRYGEGTMFVNQDKSALLGQFFGQISNDDEGSIRKRLILALAKLEPRDWEAIADMAERIIKKDPE